MRSRLDSLEMLANNLSNANTAGYKADREFYSLYESAESTGETTLPVVEKNWIDLQQGLLHDTGKPLDLALEGPGFFVTEGKAGLLYTRNGSFRLSQEGILETREGYPVRAVETSVATKDKRIHARPENGGSDLQIRGDGTVLQDGRTLGRLELASTKPDAMEKQPGGYFRFASDPKITAAIAKVHQGNLESSNVGPAESAVRLVSILRQFEMLQKAVNLSAEMNRKAVEEVAKVTG